MKHKSGWLRFFAAAAVLLYAGVAGAQTRLDLAIFINERDPYNDTVKWWMKEVQQRTEGRVEIRAHYSGSLVKLSEAFDAVRNGVVPMALVAPSFISGAMPAMGYLEFLGGYPSSTQRIEDLLPAMRPLMEKMFAAEGLVYLWQQPSTGCGIACRDRTMKSSADWKGVKVRTAGRWQAAQIKALGGVPVAIDPSEQYLALQNRTVDCALGLPPLLYGLKLNEVAPKITQLHMSANSMIYIANAAAWAKLAPADRKAIRAASIDAERRGIPVIQAAMDAYYAKLKAAKADVESISDADLRAYRSDFRPVLDQIGKASGENGKALSELLQRYW